MIEIVIQIIIFLLVVIIVVFLAYPLIRVTTKAAFRSYFEIKREYDDSQTQNKKGDEK
jgi:hypothetical protein